VLKNSGGKEKETEGKREREKKQNLGDRRKEKRNREVKEMYTALCDYHSVCLKYNRLTLFIESYLIAIK